MGNAPSAPTEEQSVELADTYEQTIEGAAAAILTSDVLLLMTGAGWSADSGLAVYRDVADVPAYHERGVTYHDLCNPRWLTEDRALFYGFWGKCFNDYRETALYEGYALIAGWRDRLFKHTEVFSKIQQSVSEHLGKKTHTAACPGAFFSFTSNVDAHHLQFFSPAEVRECHGNSEVWQCANRSCRQKAKAEGGGGDEVGETDETDATDENDAHSAALRWPAPAGYRFAIDDESALAPNGVFGATPTEAVSGDAEFGANWPMCKWCGGAARPAILMFGDSQWHDDNEQRSRWEAWRSALDAITLQKAESGGALRVTVLEVGAGGNVTTVRNLSEDILESVREAGATAHLVRVNPDLPLADNTDNQPDTFSIASRGLAAVRAIDDAIRRRRSRRIPPRPVRSDAPDPQDPAEGGEQAQAERGRRERR